MIAGGGLEVVNQNIDYAGNPFARDRLRILYGRVAIDAVDGPSFSGKGGYTGAEPLYRIGAVIEARKGLAGLGASDDCSPITNCLAPNVPISNVLADPGAFLVRAQARAEYRPTPMVTIAVAPRAQYTDAALLSYEQFSVGNYTIGRGLDPGTLQGDSGVGTSLELRYGRLSRATDKTLALQPFVFLDAAWTWSNIPGATGSQHAYTAGGGIRARWGNKLDADLSLAVPLERAGLQTRRGDVRLLFTIRARFVPWDPS